jgi:hypothetical protein
MTSSDDIME